MRRTAVFLLAFWWTACLAQGQRRVAGIVTDTHGAAISGATVRMTGSGLDQTASTDSDGRFELPEPPVPYTTTFEARGFETYRGALPLSTDFVAGITLIPKALDETQIVLITVADAASRRPQYLAGAGLWPGAPFVATGLFRAASTVEASGDPGTELDGFKIEFSNSEGGVAFAPILSVGPNQIKGIVPTDLANGTWTMTVKRGDQPSRGGPIGIGVNYYAPHVFTQNGLGFGTAVATNEAGEPITFTNPARPGSVAKIQIVPPFGQNVVRDGRFTHDTAPASLQSDSTTPGVSTIQLKIPEGWTPLQTSCAVPFRISATNEAGETRFGNQVTLPISISGPCTDALGFGPADFPLLSGSGIKILETSITEGTLLSTSRRDGTFGRLAANNWEFGDYGGVAPIDSCDYRWEPSGFRNPNAPASLALGGTASTTVPWGQFNFSPTSNAGPFSLAFANPANFTEGNYSVNFPSGFTAGGGSHTLQATGAYRRPAGRVRNSVAARAGEQGFWRGLSLSGTMDRVIRAIADSEPVDLSQIFADVNIVADDGSRGRHLIRCILDPAEPRAAEHAALLKRIFGEVLPERTNRTDVTIRFLPKEQIRHNHSNSAIDRTHVTFDSFIAIQGVNGNR